MGLGVTIGLGDGLEEAIGLGDGLGDSLGIVVGKTVAATVGLGLTDALAFGLGIDGLGAVVTGCGRFTIRAITPMTTPKLTNPAKTWISQV